MNKLEINNNKTFEDIKHIDENGSEFWYARELMSILQYANWQNFEKIIEKAKISCENSNINVLYHFIDVDKMVQIGSGAERKQKDYIEGYTQILNALREGKSPSASSQTYSGQHFWNFMDQLKPEQGEDKTTLDTTPESKYNLHGLLTRDVYHGDYSALEKDLSTPFVRTDQNKLDLDVRLDNVYNAAKNLGYTGEKTEEGLKEYLVRGNHLNSDQFNRYLGIGSTTSSESSPIKLPEGYSIVDNGNFYKQNALLVKNPNGEKEILQNING